MAEQVNFDARTPRNDLIEQLGVTVDEQGISVVTGYLSIQQALRTRRQIRNLLIPSIPLRAVRVGAEALLGRDSTPDVLQRRPVSVKREHTHRFFTPDVESVFSGIDILNEDLLATDELITRFSNVRHQVSKVVLNRFAPGEEFEKHQDSRENTGLTYIVQTSPTLWHVHPSGPREGMEPLDFHTDAGDLVVMAASKDNGLIDTSRHAGFTEFDQMGSVVHSGENLTDRNRFTTALFSTPVYT